MNRRPPPCQGGATLFQGVSPYLPVAIGRGILVSGHIAMSPPVGTKIGTKTSGHSDVLNLMSTESARPVLLASDPGMNSIRNGYSICAVI